MAAEGQNIRVYQGDARRVTIPIENSLDNLNPLNLAGSTVLWEVYQEPFRKLLLSKSTDNDTDTIKVTDAEGGVVAVTITEADTSGLKIGKDYTHYLKVKDTFGQKTTVTTGKLFIEK